jgi:hypothetical protein
VMPQRRRPLARETDIQPKEEIMEAMKRRAGRPKAAPQTGPLVLEDDRRRVKIEIELPEGTADELNEYARWVEISSTVTTADALSRTAQYALREVFRRDRLWQERRRGGDRVGTGVPPLESGGRGSLRTPLPHPPPAEPGGGGRNGGRATLAASSAAQMSADEASVVMDSAGIRSGSGKDVSFAPPAARQAPSSPAATARAPASSAAGGRSGA